MQCLDAAISPKIYVALSIIELVAVYAVGVFLELHVLLKYETFKSGTIKIQAGYILEY